MRERKTGRQLKPTYPQIPHEHLTFGTFFEKGGLNPSKKGVKNKGDSDKTFLVLKKSVQNILQGQVACVTMAGECEPPIVTIKSRRKSVYNIKRVYKPIKFLD